MNGNAADIPSMQFAAYQQIARVGELGANLSDGNGEALGDAVVGVAL